MARIASGYGWRIHPTTGKRSFHDGIDYAVPTGTPVRAIVSGTVAKVSTSGYGGLAVSLVHPGGWASYYAHLSRIYVDADQRVRVGQVIGLSGRTGRVTGPHLHVAVYTPDGNTVDPRVLYQPRGA